MLSIGGLFSLALLPCPPTRWDAAQPIAMPPTGSSTVCKTIDAPASMTPDAEQDWLAANAEELMEQLNTHGAIHLRGFSLPRR